MELALFDSNGKRIRIGDYLKIKTDNEEMHGEYAYHQVMMNGGIPVVLYVCSDKGYIMPPGYTGRILSDYYNPKDVIFTTCRKPMPDDDELFVVDALDLPYRHISEDEWEKQMQEKYGVK